jgi:molybdopterin-guanine dinucleotide biosynthesis protein A
MENGKLIKKTKIFSILHFPFYIKNIPCFILVGGKSSRFGNEKDDKAALFYKSQYEKCKKTFKKVYFAAKYKKFRNYPFFIEKSKIYAPLPVLEELLKKHKKIFVLSVDTPNVTPKTIIKLLNKKAVAADNPLIGYYDYTMLPKIRENLKGNLRIFGINKRKLKINPDELININTLNDLKNL